MDSDRLALHWRGLRRHAAGIVRAVFTRQQTEVERVALAVEMAAPIVDAHPSTLCRCPGGDRMFADHAEGCQWLALMCRACAGTGYCERCQGDGVDPLLGEVE